MPPIRRSTFGWLLGVGQGLSAVALLATSAWLISRSTEVTSIIYLSLAVVGVRAFAVGRAGLRYAEKLVQHDSAFRLLSRLRVSLFRQLVPVGETVLTKLSSGIALRRFVEDVNEVQNLSLRVVAPLVQATVVNLAASIFVMFLAPWAGFTLLVLGQSSIIIGFVLGAKSVEKSHREGAGAKDALSAASLEFAESSEIISSFGWRGHYSEIMEKADQQQAKASISAARVSAFAQALFQTLLFASIVTSAVLGALVVSDSADLGVWLAAICLIPFALFDVISVSQNTGSAWHKFKQSQNRIMDLVYGGSDHTHPRESGSHGFEAENETRFESIEFRAVSLGYPNSEEQIVTGLDFRIGSGESWALTGPSGVGKTTIALAMARLIPIKSGSLLLNGKPIDSIQELSFRKLVGLVEQRPMIFSGSVRQNLLLAKPEATDEELISVLNRVNLWDVFRERDGLNTKLGEFGQRISGGEAQRIGLARAFLANFGLIILDEPSASLDKSSAELLIRDVLRAAENSGCSVLLITHDSDLAKLPTFEVAFGTNSIVSRIR